MGGELAALGTALLWGLSGLLLKGLSARFGSIFLNSLRCVGGTLALLPLVLFTGGFNFPDGVPVAALLGMTAGTAVTIGIGDTLFVMSLKRLEFARAYPIYVCAYPLLTIVIAWIFLGERVTAIAAMGTALILSGLFFIAFPGGPVFGKMSLGTPQERIGLLLLVFSVISAAAGTVYMTSIVATMDVGLANFVRYGGVAVLLVLASGREWAGLRKQKVPWKSIGIGLGNGVLALGAGGWVFLYSLQHIGAAMTTVLTSTSPLFVLPLSATLLKEKVTRKLALGVALGVCGVVVVFLPQILGG